MALWCGSQRVPTHAHLSVSTWSASLSDLLPTINSQGRVLHFCYRTGRLGIRSFQVRHGLPQHRVQGVRGGGRQIPSHSGRPGHPRSLAAPTHVPPPVLRRPTRAGRQVPARTVVPVHRHLLRLCQLLLRHLVRDQSAGFQRGCHLLGVGVDAPDHRDVRVPPPVLPPDTPPAPVSTASPALPPPQLLHTPEYPPFADEALQAMGWRGSRLLTPTS